MRGQTAMGICMAEAEKARIGDIQTDPDGTEWIIVGTTQTTVSRVKRYSIAHEVHARSSEIVAKSLKK